MNVCGYLIHGDTQQAEEFLGAIDEHFLSDTDSEIQTMIELLWKKIESYRIQEYKGLRVLVDDELSLDRLLHHFLSSQVGWDLIPRPDISNFSLPKGILFRKSIRAIILLQRRDYQFFRKK